MFLKQILTMKHLKSILLALTLICVTAISYGQTPAACGEGFAGTTAATFDTITTSSSAGSLSKARQLKGNQESISVQVNVVKISGTISGYIQYQVSDDGGSNYYTVATDTLTNASAVYYHEWTQRAGYYKAAVTMSSSTQSTAYRIWGCHTPSKE